MQSSAGGGCLKRREFLIGGAAALTVPGFSSVATLSARNSALQSAQLIWCTAAIPVPLQSGGSAEQIASSEKGVSKKVLPDLHCVFAKEMLLKEAPTEAILHLFAFTRYRAYVNGTYVGRGPCRYQNQRPEYDSLDVRGLLNAGRNVIVVLVHRDAPTGRIMRHEPGFVAALEMSHGRERQVLGTDTSWKCVPELSFGPRAEAWASIEEHLDARKMPDWTHPDLSQTLWQNAAVVPAGEEIRYSPRSSPLPKETLRSWEPQATPMPLDLATGSKVVFTLPEIAQAYSILHMEAEAGSVFELTYALPEGEHSGRCTYIARGGVQTYMGGDSYAFRSLELVLTSGKARLLEAKAVEIRYPFERVATFACSDPFFDQLWTLCARSLELLSEDSYVDCADRERVEWTDDSPPAFDCTRVMMRGPDEPGKQHWGDARLLRGLLRRIALTQLPDGQLKAHSCSERFDIHAMMEDRTCDWIVLLREHYESTADEELVRELWPTALRLLEWYRIRRTSRGLVQAREWEVWDNPLRYQVCEGAGLNAMVYRALVDAQSLAATIGRREDAARLRQEAEELRTAYNRLLWNEQEGCYDAGLFGPGSETRSQLGKPFPGGVVDGRYKPTAQGNLFAVYSGIVPSARMSSVADWVMRHLDEITGPMSHYYLFRMMYDRGEPRGDAQVLELMQKGWKNQVESEWKTAWEELVIGGGSKVHMYGLHPGYFLTAYVLGARRDGPVERRTILLEPRTSGLQWAKGICITEFGPVAMDWKHERETLEIICTLPEDVHGRLRLLPFGGDAVLRIDGRVVRPHRAGAWFETTVTSGNHRIEWQKV